LFFIILGCSSIAITSNAAHQVVDGGKAAAAVEEGWVTPESILKST